MVPVKVSHARPSDAEATAEEGSASVASFLYVFIHQKVKVTVLVPQSCLTL